MDPNSFYIQAVVYLAAAVVFVPLAMRVGLGSVLGFLIAGIAIGPFLLGWIGSEGGSVLHFAEFGVVMMLFLIGLELEPKRLWSLRKAVLGLGSLQVLITTLLIGGFVYASGFSWQISLVTGMIMAMSSTAIVLQTLREKGLMKTTGAQNAFSVLLFQDIAVIPILALLPFLAVAPVSKDVAHSGTTWVDEQPAWLHALIVLGSVVGIIVAGRLLIKPALRAVAKSGIREMFTVFALLIVVGIAALMAKVGLSAALGTFLAGVVLANSEYRHELESDIEPFKGLLLGLFFMAVGASIDFSLVWAQPLQILAWVVVVVTIKFLVFWLLGKLYKMRTDQNLIFSFSLSQVGEFAFVLLSFALTQGILPAEFVGFSTAVVVISMVLTPLLMKLNESLILPRFGTPEKVAKEADSINEKNAVIVAGLGHFGSSVGRFLRASGVQATFLDIDSDRVDVLRKMGFKVFYGDASRYDLLHAAGATEAKIIIIAIDDAAKRLEMIETVKKHFPHLHMLVRAANRYDAYDQMNAGMLHVYRETIDTSVRLGVDALAILGFRRYTASRLAKTFIRHDEKNLKKLASIRNQDEYITTARQYIEELEAIIQTDAQSPIISTSDWDAESIREEVRAEA